MTNAGLQIQTVINSTGRLTPPGYTTLASNRESFIVGSLGTFNTDYEIETWIEKTVDITNATTHTITLDNDSLIDPFNEPVTFTSIRAFVLFLNSGPGVQIGGGTHILWFGDKTDKSSVYPELPVFTTGGPAATVDASNNTILILGLGASASNVTYWIGGDVT